jgi:O-acetyl-ADP-ribose deacetylase (regulator of RNase III)
LIWRYFVTGDIIATHADLIINAINKEILLRIQERGVAMPSSTVLNGKT